MSGFAHQTGQEDGRRRGGDHRHIRRSVRALYARDTRGGTGQVIDLSLLEPLLGILGPGPTLFDLLGVIAGRHGNRSPKNAPRNAYLTRLSDPRRALGGRVRQRHLGSRTGDAARRAATAVPRTTGGSQTIRAESGSVHTGPTA
jgi:crotonobetainyl-CoA:carnitine CoA-transferase CaiB-like acyl-CoA transferase